MAMKKAMSPLAATVLLIAFAISLGVVVMSFGSTYYENSRFSVRKFNETTLCEPISFELFSVLGAQQICYRGDDSSGTVEFVLVNNANSPIEGVQMWIVGSSIYVTDVTNKTFAPGYPLEEVIPYDYSRYKAIRNVQFIPKVKIPGSDETIFCFNRSVTVTEVKEC
jgi:flagellin-like protein